MHKNLEEKEAAKPEFYDKQNSRDTPSRWNQEKVGKEVANNSETRQYYDG